MKKVPKGAWHLWDTFIKEKDQDLKLSRKYIKKEGLFNIFVEYIFSIEHLLIYNKIEEFGEFIWK